MIYNLSAQNSLVNQWMHEIRSIEIQKDKMRFRRNLERLGEVAAYEISKELPYEMAMTQTQLGEIEVPVLTQQPVVATILRAGIPLHQGVLNYFDNADAAFIAAYRRHHRDGSFEIAQNYITCPPIENRILIMADPMLATGASFNVCLAALLEHGNPSVIHLITAIATTEGIENVQRKYPEVHIWTGAIDDELTAKGYIVPGLGDAGDLAFGNKRQS